MSWKKAWSLVVVLGIAGASACGGTGGCSGCGGTGTGTPNPIPGGFPVAQRFENAIQVRLSETGLDFIEANAGDLIKTFLPTGLSFSIPPTGCTGGSQKICCDAGATCSAATTITSMTLTPVAPNIARAAVKAAVKTTKIKFEQNLIFGWLSCDVEYDSAASGMPTVGLDTEIQLLVDAGDGNKLRITRSNAAVKDFEAGDIKISGGVSCTVVDWLKGFFQGLIQNTLASKLDETMDSMLVKAPLGREERADLSSLMGSFSPSTSGLLDYFIWAGGYARAENAGFSVGVLGGFRAGEHSPCVPVCQGTCQPPPRPGIDASPVFTGNTRPDGKGFDVGIGVHQQTIDTGLFAMYDAGGLCLDITSSKVTMLNSGLFSVLVGSLNQLTWGESVGMMLSTRPRTPPTLTLGKGTFHKDAGGTIVIDEPLLRFMAKDFAIEFYLFIDHRPVRVFTILGDLDVPFLLAGDANGDLQPVIGALDKAMTNVRVEGAELLSESDAKNLPQLFPSLIGLAGGFLGSGLAPIKVPAFQGLKLVLDSGSITTSDNVSTLAVFAKLGIAPAGSGTPSPAWAWGGPAPGAAEVKTVETRATLERVDLPAREAFRLSPSFDPFRGPAVVVKVGAQLPAGLEGSAVEYSYRIDGGFLHLWTGTSRELLIRDPVLWIPGRHQLELIARVEGRPATTDPTPAVIDLEIQPAAAAGTASLSATVTVDEEPEAAGCSLGTGACCGLGGLLLLAIPALLLLRRRRPQLF